MEFTEPRYCAVIPEDARVASDITTVAAIHKQGEFCSKVCVLFSLFFVCGCLVFIFFYIVSVRDLYLFVYFFFKDRCTINI